MGGLQSILLLRLLRIPPRPRISNVRSSTQVRSRYILSGTRVGSWRIYQTRKRGLNPWSIISYFLLSTPCEIRIILSYIVVKRIVQFFFLFNGYAKVWQCKSHYDNCIICRRPILTTTTLKHNPTSVLFKRSNNSTGSYSNFDSTISTFWPHSRLKLNRPGHTIMIFVLTTCLYKINKWIKLVKHDPSPVWIA